MNTILIVDASASDSRIMSGLLTRTGYNPVFVDSIEAGKLGAAKLPPGAVIVAAMRLPDGTAREFINWLKTEGYGFPVIAIVDNLSGIDAVEVMRGGGAVDVIQRPAIDKQLVETVAKYARAENIVLTLDNKLIPRSSAKWKNVLDEIEAIAATNANAIIIGECGTGKEQVAHQIYLHSSREQKPHITLEAGSAAFIGTHDPKSERSELYSRMKSYFRNAEGGTIIIKNVHLLSFDKQSVLLHILSEEHPDVRVICTAEPELLSMAAEKRFRQNLYYTLRQRDIALPALRESTEDIPTIADYLLKAYAAKTGKPRKRLDASAIKALKLYPWPGNVRELKDIVLFAAFHAKTDTITADDINFNLSEPTLFEDMRLNRPEAEKRQIEDALTRTKWNKSQAAKLLKISRPTLDYKIRQYGLKQK